MKKNFLPVLTILFTFIYGNAFAFIAGDFNNNGKIDHADSIGLMKVMSGMTPSFAVDNVSVKELDVEGAIHTSSIYNRSKSFFVDGDKDKYYAVIFYDNAWTQGPAEFEITRSSVHTDNKWHGSMNLKIYWHSTRSGHGSHFLEYQYKNHRGEFVSYIQDYNWIQYLIVWLRGDTTYNYRSINNDVELKEILGTGNQTCSFDAFDPSREESTIDCTYRTDIHESIKQGKTINMAVRFNNNVELNGNITSKQDICIGKCD
ncbi:conserved hypothetical protein, secreted [Candidatus Magnetomorum sp. HK-1]|nr:conserved hypothetical protein, secreted [Candidatus Magnetomorum sp. HK-1]